MPGLMGGADPQMMQQLLAMLQPQVNETGLPGGGPGIGGLLQLMQQGGMMNDPGAIGTFEGATGQNMGDAMMGGGQQPMQQPMQQQAPMQGGGMPGLPPAIQAAAMQRMQQYEQLRAEGMFGDISDEDFMAMMMNDVDELVAGVGQ